MTRATPSRNERRIERRTRLARAALLAGGLAVSLSIAQAQEPPAPAAAAPARPAAAVGVRGGDHASYSRMVFDWTKSVPYTLTRNGASTTITFASPASADLKQLTRDLPERIKGIQQSVSADGLSVTFTVPDGSEVRHFKNGNAIVIDVVDAKPGAKQVAQAEPKAEAKPESKAEAKPEPKPETKSESKPEPKSDPKVAAAVPAAKTPREKPRPSAENGADEGLPLHEVKRQQREAAGIVSPGAGPAPAPASATVAPPAATAAPLDLARREPAPAKPEPGKPEPGKPEAGKSDLAKSDLAKSDLAKSDLGKPDPGKAEAGKSDLGRMDSGAAKEPPKPEPGKSDLGRMESDLGRMDTAGAAPGKPEPAHPDTAAAGAAQSLQSAKPGSIIIAGPLARAQSPTAPAVKEGHGAAPSASTESAAAEPGAPSITFTFDPAGPSAVAVFERAGYVYVVFDRKVPDSTVKPVSGAADMAGPVEPVALQQTSVFRMAPPVLMRPHVERDGTAWRVVLDRSSFGEESLAIDSEPDFPLGPRLVVKAQDATKVLDFTDPIVGDVLKVVPLAVPGQSIPVTRRYAEAQFLSSMQGIVVRAMDDRLLVQPAKEGLELSVPGGLKLSPPTDTKSVEPPPVVAESKKMFDYHRWGHAPGAEFIRTRQRLQAAAIEAPVEERGRARLAEARFLVANGLGPEARGMLELMLEAEPDLERRVEFKAVRGAARALAGDSAGALADLSVPEISEDPDGKLWRAVAEADSDNHEAANELFQSGLELLRTYPEPFLTRFFERAVESALKAHQPEAAAKAMDRYVRRKREVTEPSMLYLRGEVMHEMGDMPKAKELWNKVLTTRDRLYRMKAEKALIDARLHDKEITPKQAVEEMEKLRFAWRGDDNELDTLRRIGDLHAMAGQYPEAFETMKRAISLYPDRPEAADLAKQLTGTFADLFLKDGAAGLAPIDALALYEQYRELTPVGAEGDAVIRKLAERLVEIDLLDRAAELLAHQVDYRLAGVAKAQVGTRLAGIRLLNNQPEEAITALDRSEVPRIPADLAEERRLLRARALSRTGRSREAVELLANDRSQPANLLRIDIAWRDKQWGPAAATLADLIGPPPEPGKKLEGQTARLVVNRAIALSQAGDVAELQKLRNDFGAAMEGTPEGNAFLLMTRPQEAAGLVDAASIRARLAEIDMFSSFLSAYRKTEQHATPAPAPPPIPNAPVATTPPGEEPGEAPAGEPTEPSSEVPAAAPAEPVASEPAAPAQGASAAPGAQSAELPKR